MQRNFTERNLTDNEKEEIKKVYQFLFDNNENLAGKTCATTFLTYLTTIKLLNSDDTLPENRSALEKKLFTQKTKLLIQLKNVTELYNKLSFANESYDQIMKGLENISKLLETDKLEIADAYDIENLITSLNVTKPQIQNTQIDNTPIQNFPELSLYQGRQFENNIMSIEKNIGASLIRTKNKIETNILEAQKDIEEIEKEYEKLRDKYKHNNAVLHAEIQKTKQFIKFYIFEVNEDIRLKNIDPIKDNVEEYFASYKKALHDIKDIPYRSEDWNILKRRIQSKPLELWNKMNIAALNIRFRDKEKSISIVNTAMSELEDILIYTADPVYKKLLQKTTREIELIKNIALIEKDKNDPQGYIILPPIIEAIMQNIEVMNNDASARIMFGYVMTFAYLYSQWGQHKDVSNKLSYYEKSNSLLMFLCHHEKFNELIQPHVAKFHELLAINHQYIFTNTCTTQSDENNIARIVNIKDALTKLLEYKKEDVIVRGIEIYDSYLKMYNLIIQTENLQSLSADTKTNYSIQYLQNYEKLLKQKETIHVNPALESRIAKIDTAAIKIIRQICKQDPQIIENFPCIKQKLFSKKRTYSSSFYSLQPPSQQLPQQANKKEPPAKKFK